MSEQIVINRTKNGFVVHEWDGNSNVVVWKETYSFETFEGLSKWLSERFTEQSYYRKKHDAEALAASATLAAGFGG